MVERANRLFHLHRGPSRPIVSGRVLRIEFRRPLERLQRFGVPVGLGEGHRKVDQDHGIVRA